MKLVEILLAAGVAMACVSLYAYRETQNKKLLFAAIAIIGLMLVYMMVYKKEQSKSAQLDGTDVDDKAVPMQVEDAHDYDGYDITEPYTDMQSMHDTMQPLAVPTKRDQVVQEGFVASGPQPLSSYSDSYAPINLGSSAEERRPSGAKVVHGNFLEVDSKDVDCHGHVVSNNSLLPIMEQYMHVHENDPTRSTVWQSNNGIPSYDVREPINVKLNDFPRTVSAKIPVV